MYFKTGHESSECLASERNSSASFAPPLLPLFLCRLVFFLLKGVRNM
jgi:hypothetical protein